MFLFISFSNVIRFFYVFVFFWFLGLWRKLSILYCYYYFSSYLHFASFPVGIRCGEFVIFNLNKFLIFNFRQLFSIVPRTRRGTRIHQIWRRRTDNGSYGKALNKKIFRPLDFKSLNPSIPDLYTHLLLDSRTLVSNSLIFICKFRMVAKPVDSIQMGTQRRSEGGKRMGMWNGEEEGEGRIVSLLIANGVGTEVPREWRGKGEAGSSRMV